MKYIITYVLIFLNSFNYLIAVTQDTDGTAFVTSFLWFKKGNSNNVKISLHLFNNDAYKANSASINYWSAADNKYIQKPIILDARGYLEFPLKYEDVIIDDFDVTKETVLIKDRRVFIYTQYSAKVVSRIFDLTTGIGDSEMVPTITMAQQSYLVKLPKPNPGAFQIIHLLTSGDDAKVTVIHDINGRQQPVYSLVVSKTVGSDQPIIIIPADLNDHSVSIYSDTNIHVVGAVTCVDLESTRGFGLGTPTSICDYATMFFHPIPSFDCTTALNGNGDRRMITSRFTKSVYISPPKSNTCESSLPISVYNTATPSTMGNMILLNQYVASTLTLAPHDQQGTQSKYTFTPWARFGGERSAVFENGDQLVSSFIHYIPETSQYLNGDIRFVTFTPNSYLEIYCDFGIQLSAFLLDAEKIKPTIIIEEATFSFFNKLYKYWIIKIEKTGPHYLSEFSSQTYIAFVSGKNVANMDGSYGYIAGYNRNNISTISSVGGTDKPPVTTTKSAGTVIESILTIVFAFVFARFNALD
uniref:IgGFc_binding domain-containing protein n=1 Tax=Rhabditophanes sp. KR3021 TaxID=114890 RepID=A0AC35U331_9BILA